MRSAVLPLVAGVVLDSSLVADKDAAVLAAGLRDGLGAQSLVEEAEWAQFGTVVMVLTYAQSPRLPTMMDTWIPRCAQNGYDIALMLCEDDPGEQSVHALIPNTLKDRVQVLNTYATLGVKDYRELERWKTWAYVRDLHKVETETGSMFSGRRHQWFMQMDDDTLPDCDGIRNYEAKWAKPEPLYLGAGAQDFHFGWLILLNRPAFDKLASTLSEQKLLQNLEQFECDVQDGKYLGIKTCCVVKDMKYADSMIGGCMAKAGIPIDTDLHFNQSALFIHPLKDPDELRATFMKRVTGQSVNVHELEDKNMEQEHKKAMDDARRFPGVFAEVKGQVSTRE